MTEENAPDVYRPQSHLTQDELTDKASRFIARIDASRQVIRLLAEGAPHETIATQVGVELRIVTGTANELNEGKVPAFVTPREYVYRRWLGQISTDEMMLRLKAWPYTFTRTMDYDGSIPGDWDQIDTLHWIGYLTKNEYTEIKAMADKLPRYPDAPLP